MRSLKIFFGIFFLGIILYGVWTYCLPIAEMQRGSHDEELWIRYENPKYGFFLEIPGKWIHTRTNEGVILKNPQNGKTYRIRALPEESETFSDPTADYMIQKLPQYHPYLSADIPAIRYLQSQTAVNGFRLTAKIQGGTGKIRPNEEYLKPYLDSVAVMTIYPSVFTGDQYTTSIEIFTAGTPDSVYERIVKSYGYLFPIWSENELLAKNLIDSTERPFESARYVGETQGFQIDVDGDGSAELLIVGFYRLYDIGEAKCFFRLLHADSGEPRKVLQDYFPENAFNRTDIQVGELNQRPGYEVLIRFSDYGSPWGSNSTVLVHYDSAKFRAYRFGAFAQIRDVDGDGKDEIVKSVNTQFSLGAIATWYDIYVYRNGDFVENNSAYPLFYQNTVLPQYRDQLMSARNEIMETNVPRIRLSLYYLVRRLDRYIRAAEELARGKSAPA